MGWGSTARGSGSGSSTERTAPAASRSFFLTGLPASRTLPASRRPAAWLRESRRQAVIDYLTDHVSAPEAELCAALRLPEGLCGELLYALLADGTVIETGDPAGDALRYQLRP